MKVLMRSLLAAGGLAAGLALSAHDAAADVVNLTNPNFDASVGLTPDSDQYITANTGTVAIPGWTINGFAGQTGTSGTLAPNYTTPGVYFNTTPNWSVPQVGVVGGTLTNLGATPGTPSGISQTTSQTFFNTGTSATVTVNLSLGEALGTTLGTAGQVELLANGGLAFGTGLPVNLETGGSVTGPFTAGTFTAETYTFDLSAAQVAALAGDTVGLEIYNPDSTGVFLDNISMSGTDIGAPSSPIPEPAGLPILGIALLGFVAFHYRQKTKLLAI